MSFVVEAALTAAVSRLEADDAPAVEQKMLKTLLRKIPNLVRQLSASAEE